MPAGHRTRSLGRAASRTDSVGAMDQHAFDFPLGDLSPDQHAALDAALDREGITHAWMGTMLQVDIAFEARVSSLVDEARGGALPVAPGWPSSAASTPVSAVPTAVTPAYPGSQQPGYAPVAYPQPGYPQAGYGGQPAPAYGYGPQAYGPPGYGVPVAPNNGLAIASMICGIAGLAMCTAGLLLGIPALVMGYIARRQIDESQGAQQGEGMAKAGIITGWIACGISLAIVVFYVLFFVVIATSSSTH